MKNKSILAAYGLAVLGLITALYGLTQSSPVLAGLGLVALAVGLVLIGIADIRSRQSSEQVADTGLSVTYTGWSAVFGGLMWVTLGIGALFCGVIILAGQGGSILPGLKEHPGPGMLLAGLALTFYGLHELIGPTEERSSFLSAVGSLPKRILSLVLLLVGIVLVGGGLFEIVLPAGFRELIAPLGTLMRISPPGN